MNDILVERATYADKVLKDLVDNGRGRTFGAHVAAFVRSHPDEAEELAQHHVREFLKYKMAHMKPNRTSMTLMYYPSRKNTKAGGAV